MNKPQEKDQVEVLVALGIGLAFVGWLISAHLAGWLGAVGAAFARFAAFAGKDLPDPQDVRTFESSKLDRSGADPELRALYRELLALRRTLPGEVALMGKLDGCALKTGVALVVFVVGVAMIPAAIIYLTVGISQGIRVVQANMAVVWVLVAAALAGWLLLRRLSGGRSR